MDKDTSKGDEERRVGSVLVVQDGAAAADALASRLRCRFASIALGSVAAARSVLDRDEHIVGALVDPILSDGDGFEIIAELKGRLVTMPILIVTSECHPAMLSRAHLAKVAVVSPRHCDDNLEAFATEVNTTTSCAKGGIDEVLEQISHTRRLSLRESQILRVAAHGVPRSHLATRLGTSENTVKSQIRSLLDKTKQPNLSEAVWLVHSQTELG